MSGKEKKTNKAQQRAQKQRELKEAAHAANRSNRPPKVTKQTNDVAATTIIVTNRLKAGRELTPKLVRILDNNPIIRKNIERALSQNPISHKFFVHVPSMTENALSLDGWEPHEISTKPMSPNAKKINVAALMKQVRRGHIPQYKQG